MSWKDAIFEKQPEKKTAVTTPKPIAVPAQQVPAYSAPPASLAVSVETNDDIYQRLFAKTDFYQTAEAKTLNRYVAPLATVITDERIKIKAAIGDYACDKVRQGAAQCHLS